MPIKGIICSSKNPAFEGEEVSFEDCLNCARIGYGMEVEGREEDGLRWCHAPYPMIKQASMNQEERKDAGLSVTMLLNDCPRQVILQQEHDYSEPAMSLWARFRGTVSHLMMEEYDEGGEGIIQEVRFSKSITVLGEEVTITGKMDHVDVGRKYILDYKSIGSVNTKPVNQGIAKPEHELQLNFYRWLLLGGTRMDTNEEVFHDIERGALIYFDMKAVRKVKAEMMDMDDIEVELRRRLEPFVLYRRDGTLPERMTLGSGKPHYFCQVCPVRDICFAMDGIEP